MVSANVSLKLHPQTGLWPVEQRVQPRPGARPHVFDLIVGHGSRRYVVTLANEVDHDEWPWWVGRTGSDQAGE